MGKHEQPPYVCVKCGFSTRDKNNIRRHFNKKKPCPSIDHEIELTDEIKDYILENRIYNIPVPEPKPTQAQIINNYNTMNNFINAIDPLKKIQDYIKHKNIHLIPFDRSVELKYEKTRLKLEKGQGVHSMSQDDIFEILDNVTKVESESLEDFNYFYDSGMKKLMMYESGDWKEVFILSGLKMTIRTIQDYLWNAYECYLIKKIRTNINGNFLENQKLKEFLQEYYTFLGCMDVDPYVKDTNNNKIIFIPDDDEYWVSPSATDNDAWSISDEYMKVYNKVKDDITIKQRDKMKTNLLDVIKTNSKRNISELNKVIISLINVDADFKRDMVIGTSPLD